jgi:hypothetical protein
MDFNKKSNTAAIKKTEKAMAILGFGGSTGFLFSIAIFFPKVHHNLFPEKQITLEKP